jgi:cyclic beta-1,2-glucan synthetase
MDIVLEPGEQRVVVLMLGQGNDLRDVEEIVRRYRSEGAASAALDDVCRKWDDVCQRIEVRTPDTPFDLLVNRWLVYQTVTARLLGRTGFYQSGGAFGFRDQLQDASSLLQVAPELAREQLLRCASRQFVEGDVQHWWHPPSGRGVRTRISDDRLWMPSVLARYVEVTGEVGILDEKVPFLEGPELSDQQEDAYLLPTVSPRGGTLYEHCVRAVERSLATGAHGLPLIGSGDWNDGMNRVGREGRGESVWLGWFLIDTLRRFAPLCEARQDHARAKRYREHADRLAAALETQAWDGAWYKRAFFDDGSPLGSSGSEECKIDSLPQSWSVISGAARPERKTRAMRSVEEHLIRHPEELVLLFTPPFDKGDVDPGYVKGYLPGVRENGGQYTHAAVWVAWAYAILGDGDRAGEVLAAINPINHAGHEADADRYKVEPYVVAADVYDVPAHRGRGGWTWYTGSAGWMYRVAVEAILGLQVRGSNLVLAPCIPSTWNGFSITYRRGRTTYHIDVENPRGVCAGVGAAQLDGKELGEPIIPLEDDAKEHHVRLVLGPAPLENHGHDRAMRSSADSSVQ